MEKLLDLKTINDLTKNNFISVVFPIYNASMFIDESIESILNQSYENFELILINDGSTDNSLEKCEKFSKSDSRIKIINNSHQGLTKSLNDGIKISSGKYIARQDADDISNLERFKIQLEKSNIQTKHSLKPNFSWAVDNIDQLLNKFIGKKFILLFPFSSAKLTNKRWPHYNGLIKLIREKYSELEIVIAPGPSELEIAKEIDATIITNNQKALSIPELAGLIKKATFIIGNDTGPSHMAAHLGKEGLVLFGKHTSPNKVSIETDKFKAFVSENLEQVKASEIFSLVKGKIDKLFID